MVILNKLYVFQYESDTFPEVLVDGWNVAFYNKEPTKISNNQKTLAEHFLAFIEFYCRFDFSYEVCDFNCPLAKLCR